MDCGGVLSAQDDHKKDGNFIWQAAMPGAYAFVHCYKHTSMVPIPSMFAPELTGSHKTTGCTDSATAWALTELMSPL